MANRSKELKHAEALLLLLTAPAQEPVEHPEECSEILLRSLGGPPTRKSSSSDIGWNEPREKQKARSREHLEKLAADEDARTQELLTKYGARRMPDDVASEIERLAARQRVLKNPSSPNCFESQSWLW